MVARRTRGTGETKADVEREVEKVDPKEDLSAGANKRTFASDALLSFCERHERLTEEIGALTDDRKEVMQEAKSMGFDSKTLNRVLKRRRMPKDQRMEEDSLTTIYEEAIADAERRQVETSRSQGS